MKKQLSPLATFLAAGTVLIGTLAAQQPTIIQPTTPIAPNGIGATTSELLFTQPYGAAGSQARGVYSVTNISASGPVRTAIATKTISIPTTLTAENYFIISPGLAGFPAGSVFSTNPSTASTDAVFKDGSLFINGIPDVDPGHAGISFDTVGTFANALIVTTPSGIFGFNSGGALLFAYPAPSGYLLESSTVAPLTNTACPGCLYLTSESIAASLGQAGAPNGNIYTIKPNTPSGTSPTFAAMSPGLEPENILFVTPQICTLSGTNFAYFVSAYAVGSQIDELESTSGALLAYTQSQIAPFAGLALVPFEGTKSIPGRIYTFNPLTNTFAASPFSSPTNPSGAPYQLEGASLVACGPARGCPATQGFWKNHGLPDSMFTNPNGTVTIAGVQYTESQLIDILRTPPAGGDAGLILMHQLIAALANIAAGAQNIGVVENGVSVNVAIAEAQSLLQSGLPQPGFPGSNPSGVAFPINFKASSGNFVQAGTTLGGYFTTLANILDAYNSAVGLNCQEGSGLSH